MDVVIPKNNEIEFLEMAKILGELKIVFLYNVKDYKKFKDKKYEGYGVDVFKGVLILEDKDINKIPQDIEYVFCKNPTRKMIECKKINYYFGFESGEGYDFLHQRNSGLNQVLCKILKTGEKKVCFSYDIFLNFKKKDVIIGRFIQNKKLCKKFKVSIEVFSLCSEVNFMRGSVERKAMYEIV